MATTEDAASAATNQATRRSRKLTEISVERMKPPATGRVQIADAVITGLWLRVTANGAKSWSVTYRPRGATTMKRVTIGRWPAVSVKDARDLARDVLLEVAKGGDPAAERKRAERGEEKRFEKVARQFVEQHVKPRRVKSWHETAALIGFPARRGAVQFDDLSKATRLVKRWRGKPVGEITRGDVVGAVDEEIKAGRHRTANKLLATTKALFVYAAPRFDLEKNPAETIERAGVERSRERVLTDDELLAIWRTAGELAWPWGSFVKMLILTAQRRSEVSQMRWQDVDLEQGWWSMPAAMTKSRRDHTVPLSAPTVAILREAPRLADDDHVFWSGRRGGLLGFSQAKRKLDRLSGVSAWRFHDARRSCATGMAKLAVPPHVLAAVLNHAPASVQNVTAIYNRFRYEGEKRQALELWAQHVLDLAEGRAGKVVALAPMRPAK